MRETPCVSQCEMSAGLYVIIQRMVAPSALELCLGSLVRYCGVKFTPYPDDLISDNGLYAGDVSIEAISWHILVYE